MTGGGPVLYTGSEFQAGVPPRICYSDASEFLVQRNYLEHQNEDSVRTISNNWLR